MPTESRGKQIPGDSVEKVKKRKVILYVAIATILMVAAVGVWFFVKSRLQQGYELEALYAGKETKISADSKVWADAAPLVLPTKNGPEVELKAVYTETRVYIKARYKDLTKDSIYYPWKYDGKNWNVGRSSDGLVLFFEDDETIKDFDSKGFELMDPGFGKKNDIYQFVQTGKKPKRGLWSGHKGRADIWIMGSGYTMAFGIADDAYFAIDPFYLQSPSAVKAMLLTQWDAFDTPDTVMINNGTAWQRKKAKGGSVPETLKWDYGPYLMYKDEGDSLKSNPYPLDTQMTPIMEDTTFSSGDEVPMVYFNSVSPGRWGGSRSDVTGTMTWSDGWWTVTVSRRLKTGHKDDVIFDSNSQEPVYFGAVVRWNGKFDTSYSLPATLVFGNKGGT